MRLIAAIMTLVALGAAALAGQKLRDVMMQTEAETVVSLVPQIGTAQTQSDLPNTPTRHWPSLFGELAPPTPPAPPVVATPEPEPQPPVPSTPPKPPIDSLGYTLNGVVRAGDNVWAMVSHPTGEQILRVGDDLGNGTIINRIDEAGLWVDNGGDEPELLGFTKQ